MRFHWINNKNNKKLILFLNGWGMDESVVNDLDAADFDILALNDYRELKFDLSEYNIEKYEKRYLVAWSMGVYTAAILKDYLDYFDKKVAISGTNKIIDNQFGIPLKIYDCTIKFFNDESMGKFIKNMFQKNEYAININKPKEILKEELIAIKNFQPEIIIKYDKAIIPNKDIIVPYKNQLNYWRQTTTQIVEINAPHYVFNNYRDWQDIIC